MDYQEMKLETINNGAIADLFNNELSKVMSNIHDLNVPADVVREVRIVVKIKPSEDRQTATTQISATSKLAPVAPHSGSVFLSFRGNRPKAYVNHHEQLQMEDIEKV